MLVIIIKEINKITVKNLKKKDSQTDFNPPIPKSGCFTTVLLLH